MKNWKKALALALCALMTASVIAGCGNNTPAQTSSNATDSATDTSSAAPQEEHTEIRLTRCLYFGDVSEYQELKDEWPKMMKEKYGVDIKVNALARNEYIQKVNLLITSSSVDGIVSMFGSSDVWGYREQGVIDPIDQYLKDNENWNKLPQIMREQYKKDDGTWALPAGYTQNLFTRTIRQDWLDNLGLSVPTNTDELYEVAKAFTLNDPDKNGKNDTYGLTASGTWNLQDIFQAFGARLGSSGDQAITYDPQAGAWVDNMLKPEMVEALTYLNKMYKEGILDPELFSNKGSNMRDNIYSCKYGSTFYWLGFSGDALPLTQKNDPNAKFTEIPYLKGKLDSQINYIWGSGTPYILIKGTKDGDKMINEFVNLMYSSEEATLDCAFGISGKTYRVDGNTIYKMIDPATGAAFQNPGLTGLTPDLTDKFTILPDELSDTDKAAAIALSDFKKSVFESGLKDGGLYVVEEKNITPDSATYLAIQGDISTTFETAISTAITGAVPVEKALETYRSEMKNLGAQKVLDEANAACGYTGSTTY